MDIIDFSIGQLAELYARRELSPVEVTRAYLDRIDRLTTSEETGRVYAAQSDRALLVTSLTAGESWAQSALPGTAGEVKAGNGLTGMRERLELFGGSLDIETRPGYGFVVLARLPLETKS